MLQISRQHSKAIYAVFCKALLNTTLYQFSFTVRISESLVRSYGSFIYYRHLRLSRHDRKRSSRLILPRFVMMLITKYSLTPTQNILFNYAVLKTLEVIIYYIQIELYKIFRWILIKYCLFSLLELILHSKDTDITCWR